jgi:hypothetical protein
LNFLGALFDGSCSLLAFLLSSHESIFEVLVLLLLLSLKLASHLVHLSVKLS